MRRPPGRDAEAAAAAERERTRHGGHLERRSVVATGNDERVASAPSHKLRLRHLAPNHSPPRQQEEPDRRRPARPPKTQTRHAPAGRGRGRIFARLPLASGGRTPGAHVVGLPSAGDDPLPAAEVQLAPRSPRGPRGPAAQVVVPRGHAGRRVLGRRRRRGAMSKNRNETTKPKRTLS